MESRSPGETADSAGLNPRVHSAAKLNRSLVVSVIVVMIVMMIVVMVVAVVLMIPVTLLHLPAVAVVVIVGMSPIGTRIRRTIPATGNPYIAISAPVPVAIDPGISFAWHGRTSLVPHGWWWGPDINSNLSKCRNCKCCRCNCCCDPFHLQIVVSVRKYLCLDADYGVRKVATSQTILVHRPSGLRNVAAAETMDGMDQKNKTAISTTEAPAAIGPY